MKIDDVLKAHKFCWSAEGALEDPVVCDGCPYMQYGTGCVRQLIADTIEVLEDCKNRPNEYETYRKVQREYLAEDARNFIAEFLADRRDCDVDDIDDSELDGFDYEYLVKRYEKLEDSNVAFNDTWRYIVSEYMEDF